MPKTWQQVIFGRPMRSIVDVNVLLPVLAVGHLHRDSALHWWEHCGDGQVGLCLPVHMGVLRLLTNIRVMGAGVLRPQQAWEVVDQLRRDPRIALIERIPQTHAHRWHANIARREPTPDLWTDAWLAAMAQATESELVTFDRGFQSFAGLKLRLLALIGNS